VKNQGNCGSCSAFASIAAIEVCFKKNIKKSFDLSEQQLLDCAYGQFNCGGCNGNPIEGGSVRHFIRSFFMIQSFYPAAFNTVTF
jgi:C1A family cysteine protease